LSAAPDNPRLILLVPAMTNRTVDYSSLGQAGFLASAITTVFCNAVANGSRGESCVIGHGGWAKTRRPPLDCRGPGLSRCTPGIYQPSKAMNAFNLGRLGRKEQALVIVDIDPIYAPEGKPRPRCFLRRFVWSPIFPSSNAVNFARWRAAAETSLSLPKEHALGPRCSGGRQEDLRPGKNGGRRRLENYGGGQHSRKNARGPQRTCHTGRGKSHKRGGFPSGEISICASTPPTPSRGHHLSHWIGFGGAATTSEGFAKIDTPPYSRL